MFDLLFLSCISSLFSHVTHNFRFHHVLHLWLITVPRNYYYFFFPSSHFYVMCIMAQICCCPKKKKKKCLHCCSNHSLWLPRIVRIVSSVTMQEFRHPPSHNVCGGPKEKNLGDDTCGNNAPIPGASPSIDTPERPVCISKLSFCLLLWAFVFLSPLCKGPFESGVLTHNWITAKHLVRKRRVGTSGPARSTDGLAHA